MRYPPPAPRPSSAAPAASDPLESARTSGPGLPGRPLLATVPSPRTAPESAAPADGTSPPGVPDPAEAGVDLSGGASADGAGTAIGRAPHPMPPTGSRRRPAPWARRLAARRAPSPVPDTIEAHLAEVFGHPVRAVPLVRPDRRAGRKPVLAVRGPSGRPLAFVKVGDHDRARALVRHEAETLRLVAAARPQVVTAPDVLYHDEWHGLELLALAPLPVRRGRVPAALLNRAVHEIALLGRSMAGAGPQTTTGHAWHGDFSAWNIAPGPGGRLLVWDWERFATGVPLGFDALHHAFQRALRRMRPRAAAESCVARSFRTLAPFGLSAGEARQAAVHYLIAIADRYEQDGHHPLGPPADWLTPVIDAQEAIW
ncbi:hypothetical protein Sru01_28660 [Sphaerisporangium rufum]|uniref:Aminoglycoside phosphotransferase domain-containing protein n=1 Tax=Sphaerisporangium rufum TaxID=1381558 RepID=A0A919R1G6_9ACTN|nr:hypothetical protein [Sphaerisporangium rufum]GII77884.1 hypothetical protein Sru01_28660 [Sphaerisporangium rufum]